MSFIGLETTDARAMAAYLRNKGLAAPASVEKDGDGNLSFMVNGPDYHPVQFLQYMPGFAHFKFFGQHLPETRTSERIIHVGVHITDRKATDHFYVDILNCRLMWEGGPADDKLYWISVMLPEGSDWIEYMANPGPPTVRSLGSMHHMALGVPEVQKPYETIISAGTAPSRSPSSRGTAGGC